MAKFIPNNKIPQIYINIPDSGNFSIQSSRESTAENIKDLSDLLTWTVKKFFKEKNRRMAIRAAKQI